MCRLKKKNPPTSENTTEHSPPDFMVGVEVGGGGGGERLLPQYKISLRVLFCYLGRPVLALVDTANVTADILAHQVLLNRVPEQATEDSVRYQIYY